MLTKFLTKIVGDPNEKELKRLQPLVEEINGLEGRFTQMENDGFKEMTQQFRQRLFSETTALREALAAAEGEYAAVAGTDEQRFARIEVERIRKELLDEEQAILDEMMPEAFAAVREAARRTIGLRQYDVQLIGGGVLHSSKIAEMKTGEGKTLVATLPLYLNALAGRGAHLVTPNDYLSKVGLQLMGPVYQLLGLSAAVIQNTAGNPDKGSFLYDPEFPAQDDRFQNLLPISRQQAYQADITYGTNNEFGFEAARRTIGLRQYDVQLIGGGVLHSSKIAEMKTGEGKTLVATLPLYLNALAGRGAHLVTPNDYLSKVGLQLMGPVYQLLGLSAAVIQNSAGNPDKGSFLYDPEFPAQDDRFQNLRPILRQQAYQADITYGTNNEFGFDYLRDNMVLDKERRSQRELHYAIVDEVDNILVDEARTPLIISGEAQESSSYYSQFSQMVRGMRAGTDYEVNEKEKVATLTEEGIAVLEKNLGLENLYDPVNFEMLPYLDNALRGHALYHRDKDYIIRGNEVIIVDEFTGRLMEGRRYGEGLHQAIEAKEGVRVKRESMTLATITFQNFFRMYNKLAGMTGTAKTEEEEFQSIYNLDVVAIPTHLPTVREDNEDVIYKNQSAKFGAVIDEIISAHEQGQPVLVGTVAIETSELASRMLSRRGIPHEVLNAKNHEREATIIAQAGRPGAVTIATNMAGRGVDILLGGNYEGLARDQLRKDGVDLTGIPQLAWNHCLELLKGGQDPTTSYNTPWAAVLKERWDETKKDQEMVKAVGGLYVVGTERHEARRIDNQLRGRSGRLGDPGASRFFLSLEDDLVRRFGGDRVTGVMDRLGLEDDQPIKHNMISKAIENAQTRVEGHNFDIRKHVLKYDEVVNEQRETIYMQRRRLLNEPSLKPAIQELIADEIDAVVEQHTAHRYEEEWNPEELPLALRTVFPFPQNFDPAPWQEMEADAITEQATEIAHQVYDLKEQEIDADMLRDAERQIMLRAVDHRWVRHLTDLDRLREGVGLQAIAQVDPLVAYKREAYAMYQELMNDIRSDIVKTMMTLQVQRAPTLPTPIARNIQTNRQDISQPKTVRNTNNRPKRNDPCWCGSGKKYKICHMKADAKQGGAPVREVA